MHTPTTNVWKSLKTFFVGYKKITNIKFMICLCVLQTFLFYWKGQLSVRHIFFIVAYRYTIKKGFYQFAFWLYLR